MNTIDNTDYLSKKKNLIINNNKVDNIIFLHIIVNVTYITFTLTYLYAVLWIIKSVLSLEEG